MELIISRACT